MARSAAISHEILHAALAGLEATKKTLEQHILQVQSLLGTAPKKRGRPPKSASAPAPVSAKPAPKKRGKMSPAARKKMAALMKKRWAAAKKAGKKRIG